MPAATFRNSKKAPTEQKIKVKKLKYFDTCTSNGPVLVIVVLVILAKLVIDGPEDSIPDSGTPNSVIPDSVTPDSVTSDSVTPDSVTCMIEGSSTETITYTQAYVDLFRVLDLEERSRELCNKFSRLNNFVCVLTTAADELIYFDHGLITEYLESGFPLRSGWKLID